MAYSIITSDSFNRANGNLTGSTLDNAGGGAASVTWVDEVGTWLVTSNKIASPTAASADYVTRLSRAAIADSRASFVYGSGPIGIVLRWTSGTGIGNFYTFIASLTGGGDTRLYKSVNGTFTQLGSTGPTTVTAGKVCQLECIGTTVRCYVDGVLEISVTDSTHASGQAGFYGGSPASTADDFVYEEDGGGGGSFAGPSLASGWSRIVRAV